MGAFPHDWIGLVLIVFILGLKHGLDPDHLATIDGLTRANADRSRLSRWSGLLFSLGHGLVVMLVAAVIGVVAKEWQVPVWFQHLGAWISIGFLIALGLANLAAVFNARPDQMVILSGIRLRWLGRLANTSHPVLIAMVGALFALSFDTLSQAALFSLTASHVAGWLFSAALGLVFMLGMMVTDGINGLWISHLLSRADQRARVASRVMSLTVAGLSLLIGTLGMAKYLSPTLALHTEGRELLFGFAVIAVIAFSFYLATRWSRSDTGVNT